MIEKALHGGKAYWALIVVILGVIGVGVATWFYQYHNGLTVTGLNRDVSWGLYIGQLTFFVGVAASAVMLVLPYYLHDYKAFGKMTVLGEFVAIASVIMCVLFVFVDLGKPMRITNVFLHPNPISMMFWDTIVLSGYMLLNILISRVALDAEKKGIAPPKWIKPFIILSIPWAVSIHTVTAFLYAGLVARPFWMTAVMAPRFLASAFAAGPALLMIFALIIRKFTKFDPGEKAINRLSIIITYSMAINVFLILMEVFTAAYSGMPEHLDHFKFLYTGITDANGVTHTQMVPWMWASSILALVSLFILFVPKLRKNHGLLFMACAAVFISLWIDKGFGLMIAGFTPTPTHQIAYYMPTLPEWLIMFGIFGIGAFIITTLYKVALTMRGAVK